MPSTHDTHDHVVLLHGLGRTSLSMRKLANALQSEGFIVHNIDYPSRSASIHDIVHHVLIPRITRACPNPQTRIHFVGHSMGAILIRALLADQNFRERYQTLGNVVQLAPPNQGSIAADKWSQSTIARFFLGPAVQEMTTNNTNTVHNLPHPHYPLGIIAGKHDKKVLVDQSQLNGSTHFLIISGGHTFIMRRNEAISAVVKFLKEGRF